ncbi:ROK family protein [Williamsoniiplasma luminosum]|uniref:ROK family protein n=1 Tax=Williamsoniiplasma luminosum TaxID=214888 RepID=A0A2S0NJ10_9MOLU|nr:ROK family protein [Williamsoniiplasma luminosum]AVP48984.1 MAG: ROK family protein [Williamsoniiplasma luminosum]
MNLVLDIGGMSTKIAICDNNNKFIYRHNFSYPNLISIDVLVRELEQRIFDIILTNKIDNICISSPGNVNPVSGEIKGLSAIQGLETFNFKLTWEPKFKLPVFIDNDANCAAIAELEYGNAKNEKNVVVIVIGTGVGGSLIIDGKIHRGNHFFAGEYGYLLNTKYGNDRYLNVSQSIGIANLIQSFKKRTNKEVNGEQIYDLYNTDNDAKTVVEEMIHNTSKLIYNLSFIIDPDLILIGGAISKNILFINLVNKELKTLYKKIGLEPQFLIKSCKYYNDSNLIGANMLSSLFGVKVD